MIISQQRRAALGLGADPFAPKKLTVSRLIERYVGAGYPDKRLQPRTNPKFLKEEKRRLLKLAEHFGEMPADSVRIAHLHDYHTFRTGESESAKGGHRSVDLELCTLSSVLNYGVGIGLLDRNHIERRPRFTPSSIVDHCRDKMPKDGDELNRIVGALLASPYHEVYGWQYLIEAMTGLRTSEALALKIDPPIPEPGSIEGTWLHIHRAKRGQYPQVHIHPDLQEVIRAHRNWIANYMPKSQYWFPLYEDMPARGDGISKVLPRVCAELGLPKRTSHGARAYFVTLQRRAGKRDEEVAQMIGDKTVDLIRQTYGARGVNEEPLSWRPKTGDPAWAKWLP